MCLGSNGTAGIKPQAPTAFKPPNLVSSSAHMSWNTHERDIATRATTRLTWVYGSYTVIITLVWWLCKELNTGSLGTFVWTMYEQEHYSTRTPQNSWLEPTQTNHGTSVQTCFVTGDFNLEMLTNALKPNESKCYEPNKHQPTGVNSYICRLTKFLVPMKKWFPGSQIHIFVFDFPSHKLAICLWFLVSCHCSCDAFLLLLRVDPATQRTETRTKKLREEERGRESNDGKKPNDSSKPTMWYPTSYVCWFVNPEKP